MKRFITPLITFLLFVQAQAGALKPTFSEATLNSWISGDQNISAAKPLNPLGRLTLNENTIKGNAAGKSWDVSIEHSLDRTGICGEVSWGGRRVQPDGSSVGVFVVDNRSINENNPDPACRDQKKYPIVAVIVESSDGSALSSMTSTTFFGDVAAK